jgi:hypothetical protein
MARSERTLVDGCMPRSWRDDDDCSGLSGELVVPLMVRKSHCCLSRCCCCCCCCRHMNERAVSTVLGVRADASERHSICLMRSVCVCVCGMGGGRRRRRRRAKSRVSGQPLDHSDHSETKRERVCLCVCVQKDQYEQNQERGTRSSVLLQEGRYSLPTRTPYSPLPRRGLDTDSTLLSSLCPPLSPLDLSHGCHLGGGGEGLTVVVIGKKNKIKAMDD